MESRVRIHQSECTISILEAHGTHIWQTARRKIVAAVNEITLREFPNASIHVVGVMESSWYDGRTPVQQFDEEPDLYIGITLTPEDALKEKLKGSYLVNELAFQLAPF